MISTMFKQLSNTFSKIKPASQAPKLSHAATAVERTPDVKGNTTVRLNVFPQEQQKKDQSIKTSESEKKSSVASLPDEAILKKIASGELKPYRLEHDLESTSRAVNVRRQLVEDKSQTKLADLPWEHYNYDNILGKCCENVIGYVPVPIGVVGPLQINGELYSVPMATTEGALVASTHRGCNALNKSGGVNAITIDRGMTRAPCVRLASTSRAAQLKLWLDEEENFKKVEEAFNSTSRFGRLNSIRTQIAGKNAYIRFKAFSGDAMGMNMISKGVEKALSVLTEQFPELEIVSLSGNSCTDKKPSDINWIEGRGVSVSVDAVIKGDVVKKVLKTTVDRLVYTNINKNFIGSSMAGSIGGFNAHASNIVTAIFLATGQDVAQNVESSSCITVIEPANDGKDLYISCSMPSIEVGTVGGGTGLPAQSSMLSLLNCKGATPEGKKPGSHSERLAHVIASTVMAGELSLLSALSSGDLVKSHMKLNRAKAKN